MSNIYHIMKKDVRYHKGGVSVCEADGHWLGKNRGWGVQRFGFVRGDFLKWSYSMCILLGKGRAK